MFQESDFDSLSFFFSNSYNILQSYALSWFLLPVKFPAQNPFMNSRFIGILHCLFGISTWMTNRNFNLYKSKIEYLVFPTPPKHTVPTASLSQSMTLAPIQLLGQKEKKKRKSQNHAWHRLFPYIRESYGLYFQSIFRIWLILPNSPIPVSLWLKQPTFLAWMSAIAS